MGKGIWKNISKNLSAKYNQKLLNRAKNSATDALRTSSKGHSKNSRSNWWFDCNEIANRITKFSKNSQQNNLETEKWEW